MATDYKVLMTNIEFIDKLRDIADNYKTLYVKGCFGAPLTKSMKERTKKNEYNATASRQKKIQAASEDTFGFDCVCLPKGIFWGWNGDKTKKYGGASYASNTVPDIGTGSIIKKCTNVSTDFTKIDPGELMWKEGHVGIYIGSGVSIECTPQWKDCVQYSCLYKNSAGIPVRDNWEKHGKLPWVDYIALEGSVTYAVGDYVKILKAVDYNDKEISKENAKRIYIIDFIDDSRPQFPIIFLKAVDDKKVAFPIERINIAKTTYTPPKPKPVPYVPAVGDQIKYDKDFTYLYANLNVKRSKQKPGVATIDRIYQLGKSKHPYHITSKNLRGWVDENSFTKAK